MITFELIENIAALRALADRWKRLWFADVETTPFQSPEWLIPWAECFCDRNSSGALFSVVAHDQGEMVALFPLYIYASPTDKVRQLLLLGAGTSDYLGGVFSSYCCRELLSEFTDFIFRWKSRWDIMHLGPLRPLSRLIGLQRSSEATITPCSEIPILDYRIPSKMKKNLAYYQRRAEALGELRLHVLPAEEVLDGFASMTELHAQRWKKKGQPGVFSDTRVVNHHRRTLPVLCRSHLARLYKLAAEDHVLAMAYVLMDPREESKRAYYYITGLNGAFRHVSPGSLLLKYLLDALREEGVLTLDLLRGTENYKKLWGAKAVPAYSFSVRSTTFAQVAA